MRVKINIIEQRTRDDIVENNLLKTIQLVMYTAETNVHINFVITRVACYDLF